MSDKVRIGVIGMGGMGTNHAKGIRDGLVERAVLTAISDVEKDKSDEFPDAKYFSDPDELLDSGNVDAVLIATPHYAHTALGIKALEKGFHVLVEKPISVHKADAEKLIAAHRNDKQVFAAMFNVRTDWKFRAVKKLVDGGELGEILRVNWIVTDWFRTEAYYASGGWRATWEGEGGGVLLNQCPHQLDLLQWICGMPKSVRAFAGFGVRHNIEVEDQVTAYLEYENGATGVFITTTGEAPGTNRLEIAGENGKVVVESGKVTFFRNASSCLEFCKSCTEQFGKIPVEAVEISGEPVESPHRAIIENFVDAILDGTPLIAPAEEGINSVELANAMILSALKGETVVFPMDGAEYEKELKRLIEESKYVKAPVREVESDMENSFQK